MLLEACPLCRSVLREELQRCPECGGELQPFRDRAQQGEALERLARRQFLEGDVAAATQSLALLGRITSVEPQVVLELQTRLALARGELSEADALVQRLPQPLAQQLSNAVAEQRVLLQQAREFYNEALYHARQGSYELASRRLSRAAQLAPRDARIWQLKLKTDLKARRYSECYEDLRALDSMQARPLEFVRLEALLPSLS